MTRKGFVSIVALGSLLLCGAASPDGCQTAPPPSHKGAEAAAIAIVAGVVIGTVVLVEVHKSHHIIKGCVTASASGLQLMNVKDNRTYTLLGATSHTHVGDIVQLRGNKEKEDGGERAFVVKRMRRDYGPCDAAPEPAATATLSCTVVDAATHRPIAGATVGAGAGSANTDYRGNCTLANLAAGPVTATATAQGYEQKSLSVNVEPESANQVRFELQRHSEGDMERSIGQTGSVALNGVQFDTNSSTLRPDSNATLDKALRVILARPNSHWVIAGFTDNQGSADLNQKLSEARANAVMNWLVDHGIAPTTLTARGYGDAQPVADNSTDAGRQQNRRVELKLVQ